MDTNLLTGQGKGVRAAIPSRPTGSSFCRQVSPSFQAGPARLGVSPARRQAKSLGVPRALVTTSAIVVLSSRALLAGSDRSQAQACRDRQSTCSLFWNCAEMIGGLPSRWPPAPRRNLRLEFGRPSKGPRYPVVWASVGIRYDSTERRPALR